MQPKQTLILLGIIIISSCSRSSFYNHQSLSSLPSEAHNNTVEVFFDEAEQPNKDYIELYDLRLVKRGSFNDRQMVRFLKEEAQNKGLDAVMQINKWNETEERTTLLDVLVSAGDVDGYETTTTVTHSFIEAKGIKYIENIDLSRSVKTGLVIDDITNKEVGKVHYLPNGLISETEATNDAAEIMLDIYYKLSEDRLLHEKKDWLTLHHADGRIDVRRKLRMNDWLLERVRVRYDANNKHIRAIRLTEDPNRNAIHTKISYFYNSTGQLTERKATGARPLKEQFQYKDGLLSGKTIEHNGNRYRVEFDFYAQEDLQSLIKKVE